MSETKTGGVRPRAGAVSRWLVGGTVLVAHALWRDRVADPAQRDDTVADFRLLLTEIAASSAVISALSPVGDGLLQLTKIAE